MSPPYNFPALSKIPKKLFATIHYHFGYLGSVGPRTDGTFPPENWLPLTSSKRRYWYQPRARSYSECGQWKLQLCTLWIQIWKIWEEKMPRQQMNTETHAYHERSELPCELEMLTITSKSAIPNLAPTPHHTKSSSYSAPRSQPCLGM